MSRGGRQRPDLPINVFGRRAGMGSWGKEALNRAEDRDALARASRPHQPSTSEPLSRCTTCAQWGSGPVCRTCGVPWHAAEKTGFAPVTETEPPHRRR